MAKGGLIIMNISDFDNISMNGRIAYAILCTEKYLVTKYPNEDWSALSKKMWKVTSTFWDEWDNKFIEIIPEYLFEFNTYADSDFEELSELEYNHFASLFKNKDDNVNILLMKLHELYQIYSFSSIPNKGIEASKIVIETCNILELNNIDLPDINVVKFSLFSEKNGWGNYFDGEKLSIILSKQPNEV